MPELPEVETTRRGIEPHILNQSISHVVVRQPSLRWQIPADLPGRLKGLTIRSVKRRAKYLLLEVGDELHLLIHLGMSGSLKIVPENEPLKKHDHVDIRFNNGTLLRYHDPRRFGAILLVEGELGEHKLLRHLGIEPLEGSFCLKNMLLRAFKSQRAIKIFLMDQRIVVGIGNIYANEALFAAGISPFTPVHSVTTKQWRQLILLIKEILQRSVDVGGTTLKDFLQSDGKPGYFSQSLSVYGMEGKQCPRCAGTVIKAPQGGRSSWYCPDCQK